MNKINQVSCLNRKAVFITSSRLQAGAYNIAKSNGMMLIEVSQDGDPDVKFYKKLPLIQDEKSTWRYSTTEVLKLVDKINDILVNALKPKAKIKFLNKAYA